jgi:hypothetical protein
MITKIEAVTNALRAFTIFDDLLWVPISSRFRTHFQPAAHTLAAVRKKYQISLGQLNRRGLRLGGPPHPVGFFLLCAESSVKTKFDVIFPEWHAISGTLR